MAACPPLSSPTPVLNGSLASPSAPSTGNSEGLPLNPSAPDLFPSVDGFTPGDYAGPRGAYSKMSPADRRLVDQQVEQVQQRETPREVTDALLISGTGNFLKSGPVRALNARAAEYRAQQPNPFKAWMGTALMTATLAAAELKTTVLKFLGGEKRPGDRDPHIHPSAVDHSPARPSGHETGFAAVDFSAMRLRAAPRAELLQETVNGGKARVVLGLHDESEVAAGYEIGKAAVELVPQQVWDWLAVPTATR